MSRRMWYAAEKVSPAAIPSNRRGMARGFYRISSTSALRPIVQLRREDLAATAAMHVCRLWRGREETAASVVLHGCTIGLRDRREEFAAPFAILAPIRRTPLWT